MRKPGVMFSVGCMSKINSRLKPASSKADSGSSTDTIYRTENDSPSDWWKDNERGWRIFRWSLVLLAVLLVLGLVIYFLMIDMQVLAPVLTKNKDSYEGKKHDVRWTTDASVAITDDVVSLKEDVNLNFGDVTYHEGQFHVTPKQAEPGYPPATDTSNTSKDNPRQDFVEIVPAPNLGSSPMSEETDVYEQPTASSKPDSTEFDEESTINYPTTINIGEIYNNTATTFPVHDINAEFLYATSQLLNKIKPTTQQSQEYIENKGNRGNSETEILFEQIIKQTLPSKANRNKPVYARPPPRNPVFPTVPPSSTTHHVMETTASAQHNESEGLCFSPRLPMCRGVLPYDLTTLPLVPGVTRLADLDAALPYFEMILESGCSARARQFVCSLLEPECQPMGDNLILPCRKVCKAVAEECSDFILATLDLSRAFKCDLYPDEEDVQCVNFARGHSCLQDEFRCPDGTCIPSRWYCDTVEDCPLAADELNCTYCNTEEFRCASDSKCISQRWQCDGQRDCDDGSDEYNCPTREGCGPGQFQCEDQSTCISTKWLCDGSTQCPDNSDEKNCSDKECHIGDFRCRQTGECITALWRCNGVNDCRDNSDEDHCTVIKNPPRLTAMPHTSPCPAGELRCLDGRCITLKELCDGKQDCSDGADEANCGVGV